ncbi:transposase family protein [Micromonospora tarapacensis]|uniref:transposase family protein n=1 Tax=Micromonospora tarapacensis TaxID=2835305 RepID=UPI001E39DB6E|nr:transposase family protein [Micromonospora tarapacensis]
MTGLPIDRLADLIGRVREIVGDEWEKPPVGRPHVLPLPVAVIAVLFGLRHNMPDEVLAEVFGCSQATITRYHQILRPILRWVTRPEVDQRLEQTRRDGVLVDGFVAPVGERESYHGLYSGKKHVSGQNVQVIADLDGRLADVGDPVNATRHDAAAFHVSGIAERWADHYTPGGPGMIGDGGYQGTGPITPHRKPPGRELTTKQKAYNYSVNRLRAAVERAISHLKNRKILKTGYHRIMTNFPDVSCTVTALEIFRTATPEY